jgi:hypothetical protein
MSLAAWLGVAVGVGALVFAYLAWRVSKRQLRLAQEEAELRPQLVASAHALVFHTLQSNTPARYEQAALAFEITNNGRTAAHGVLCVFRLEEPFGEPDPRMGGNSDFQTAYIGPKQTLRHEVLVSVRGYGSTTVRYSCICDEVGETEGVIDFEVFEKDS